MKKLVLFICTISVSIFIFSMPVHATDKEVYFVNMNGVELTKEQYDNLLKGFSYDTINTMSAEMIDMLKNDSDIHTTKKEMYVKSEVECQDNEVVDSKQTVISKEEYENSPDSEPIITHNTKALVPVVTDYHETAYKKISFQITYGASVAAKFVTLTNVWKQIPKTKSFDVLAIAPDVFSLSFNIDSYRSGYQKWDGNTINYSASSKNWKIVNGFGTLKKGLGLSQNIVDDTKRSLSNSITVVFICNAASFTARGSYQHADYPVTLKESQDYSISSSGMGGLIDFSSSVWKKYDTTGGVKATLN